MLFQQGPSWKGGHEENSRWSDSKWGVQLAFTCLRESKEASALRAMDQGVKPQDGDQEKPDDSRHLIHQSAAPLYQPHCLFSRL